MMMASSISKTLKSSSAVTTKLRTALVFNPYPIRCLDPIGPTSAPSYSAFSTLSSVPLSSNSSEHQRSQWSKWMLFLPGAMTFGLGTWQIIRRDDKIKMLEHRLQRLAEEPAKWSNVSSSSSSLTEKIDSLEFRRILCKGVFDEKKSIFVGPRSRSISGVTENGYYLITPLVPISNDPDSIQKPILVNRGWIPRSWRDKFLDASCSDEEPTKPISVPSGEKESSRWTFWSKKQKPIEEQVPDVASIEVTGVIRGSEKPSIFVPPNDPNSFQWFYVDVPAMARACGLPDSTLYIEDINENVNPSSPYPIPKDANTLTRSSVMPQDHLNYAITCAAEGNMEEGFRKVMGESFKGKKPDSPRTARSHHFSNRGLSSSASLVENLLGLFRIRVKRGLDLAVCDVCSSDPYVVVKMGKQKFKTQKTINLEWNEDSIPVKLKIRTASRNLSYLGTTYSAKSVSEVEIRLRLIDLPGAKGL